MFTNTAYEAMYQYIGLGLHSRLIEVITSQKVFQACLLLIFGFMFFTTMIKFASRYLPGSLVSKHNVPITRFIKIIFCLFIGISLLRVGASSNVVNYSGVSWHENPYLNDKINDLKPEYKVSLIFDLLSRTAEEIGSFLNEVVDNLFNSGALQTKSPDFFYKAIIASGTSTIQDKGLRNNVDFYTNECFDKVIPLLEKNHDQSFLDRLFKNPSTSDEVSKILSDTEIDVGENKKTTCLELRNKISNDLFDYTTNTINATDSEDLKKAKIQFLQTNPSMQNMNFWFNFRASSELMNYYLNERESILAIQKGSQVPGTTSRIVQYLDRIMSIDGILSIFGGSDVHGAFLAAKRSEEFSENLQRAPHLSGGIKMLLIAFFPLLIFVVVAGYWKAIVWWFMVYLSVVLWAPLWTLLYHVVTHIAYSAEVLSSFQSLSDGVSVYGAALVTSRIYHLYSVYSWAQVIIGPLFTIIMVMSLRPLLSDVEVEKSPEFIDDTKNLAATGAKMIGG